MKKNLLYLFALICSMTLFTACSDDDDNTPQTMTTADLAGTYTGTLTLALGEGTEPTPVPNIAITVTRIDDTSVNVKVADLDLGMGTPLSIELDCTAALSETSAALSGNANLEIPLFPGTPLPTTLAGTCDGTNVDLDITVTEAPAVETVHVSFTGTK